MKERFPLEESRKKIQIKVVYKKFSQKDCKFKNFNLQASLSWTHDIFLLKNSTRSRRRGPHGPT